MPSAYTHQESNAIAGNAGEDLSMLEYHAGKKVGDDIVPAVAADASSALVGVLRGTPRRGENAQIQYREISPVCVGGAVSEGAFLTVGANSRFVPVTTAGARYHAIALEDATADRQVIAAIIERGSI